MFASLTDEIKHLNTVFIKIKYSTDIIERNTYIRTNDGSNNSYTTTATIPYMRGTSETVARILRPYVQHPSCIQTPVDFTLRSLLTNVTGKEEPVESPRAVYQIKCSDCQATYTFCCSFTQNIQSFTSTVETITQIYLH